MTEIHVFMGVIAVLMLAGLLASVFDSGAPFGGPGPRAEKNHDSAT